VEMGGPWFEATGGKSLRPYSKSNLFLKGKGLWAWLKG
jgi:hypothetical protein